MSIFNTIKRWLTGSQAPSVAPTPVAAQYPVLPEGMLKPIDECVDRLQIADVRGAFYQLLFEQDGWAGDQLLEIERRVVAEVEQSLDTDKDLASDLPRFPAIVPELLRSLNAEGSSHRDIADVIHKEPSLVIRLLKRANSAYYRQLAGDVTTVEQSIRVLGINGVRSAVADSLVQPILRLSPRHHNNFPKYIWQHSLQTAQACQVLATRHQVNSFHAYLAGLIHEVGKILLFQRLMSGFDKHASGALPRSTAFIHLMSRRSSEIAWRCVADLPFPAALTDALRRLANSDGTRIEDPLGRVLFLGNFVSEAGMLVQHRQITNPQAVDFLKDLGLTESDAEMALAACRQVPT